MSVPNNSFDKIKARYLVFIWFLPFVYMPGADTLIELLGTNLPWYWWNIFYYYYSHLFIIVTILLLGYYARINWVALFGARVILVDAIPALKLTLFIFIFSIAAAYLLFIPLSYLMPDFVQWWFIDVPELIYYDGESYPFIPNILGLISLVVIAPLVEEVVFRGMLLHRWTQKLGLKTAILLSSLIFGIVHPDPIGAFVFGIGMCILYLITQSLFIPIICHASNNLVVWIIEVGYTIVDGPNYKETLEEFRSDWYVGAVCIILVIIWVESYFRNPTELKRWKLPAV